jgi:drug/metabolite transporter (DMT)-like permease
LVRLDRVRDWGMLLLCNLIWGSQFVVYKIVQQQTGPAFAALLPITVATLLLTPIVFWIQQRSDSPNRRRMPVEDIWQFILIGIAGQVVAQLFVAWGVRYTLASNAALLVLTLPVATAFMAYLFLGERMTRVRWIGFGVAIAGVITCSGLQWGAVNLSSGKYLLGNLMVFAAINGSAFYNSYSKKLLRKYSPLEVLLYSYYVVILVMLPLVLLIEPYAFLNMVNFKPTVWLGFILLAVLQYFLAMIIFLSVLKRLDATQVGLSNYLIPFFGVLVAAIVLKEHLTRPMVLGGAFVLAGTLLVTVYDRRIQVPTPTIGEEAELSK